MSCSLQVMISFRGGLCPTRCIFTSQDMLINRIIDIRVLTIPELFTNVHFILRRFLSGAVWHMKELSVPIFLRMLTDEMRLISEISRFCDVPWAPRSPDFTPLYFFCWGHLKEIVYNNRLRDLDELKENIIQEILAWYYTLTALFLYYNAYVPRSLYLQGSIYTTLHSLSTLE